MIFRVFNQFIYIWKCVIIIIILVIPIRRVHILIWSWYVLVDNIIELVVISDVVVIT